MREVTETNQVCKEGPMTKQFWANLALCTILAIVAIFFVIRAGSALTPKGLFVDEPEPSAEAAALLDKVELVQYEILKDPEKMVEASFFVQNDSDQDIDDITIVCDFYDKEDVESAEFRDRKIWKFAQAVPAGSHGELTSVAKRFIHSDAKAYDCSIADFEVVSESFFTLERHAGGSHEEASAEGHAQPAAH